jgi:hypothetical protein
VSDLRRFRTHREYVVRTGEEVVARAQADWLFLGTTAQGKLRPRRPPEAMQDAFPFDPALGLRGEPPLAWADPDGAATNCLDRGGGHEADRDTNVAVCLAQRNGLRSPRSTRRPQTPVER